MKNRANRLLLLAAALAGAAAGSACGQLPADPPGSAAPPARAPGRLLTNGQTRVQGEYLITLAPGAGAGAISDVYGQLGVKNIRQIGPDLFLLTVGNDPGPEKMEALRTRNPGIKAIQPNFIYRPAQPPGGARLP